MSATGFRNNSNLKAAGTTDSITKEEYSFRVRELVKCREDPVYFANKYFKIITLDKGVSQINLYPKQKELLRFFVERDRSVVLASRQSCKTTTYVAFCTWYLTFHTEKKILILANKQDTALEIISRIQLAYEHLPQWIKPGLVTMNKGELVFDNRSSVKGFATSSSAARSQSANCVILDEAAFVPVNIMDSVFTSIYPVISSVRGTKFIMVSTPNGVGNLFHTLYMQAKENAERENGTGQKAIGWMPFRMDYWDIPGRDEAWKAEQLASIGEERFRQEFGNEFLSSSHKKLIPDEIIERYRKTYTKYKLDRFPEGKLVVKGRSVDYLVKIWYDFDPSRTYLASVDISDGVGKDASVLDIWDVTDYGAVKQAASFSSNTINIPDFCYVAFKTLNRYYRPPLIGESNGIGKSFFDQLSGVYGYDNFAMLDKGRPGVYSSISTKSTAARCLQEYATTSEFSIEIHEKMLIDDMENFVRKESKSIRNITYSAIGNTHDDHIMSLVWAMYALSTELVDKFYYTRGSIKTSIGKTYPEKLYSMFQYETVNPDLSGTELDAVAFSEQWKRYINPGLKTNSEDYERIVEYDGLEEVKKTIAKEEPVREPLLPGEKVEEPKRDLLFELMERQMRLDEDLRRRRDDGRFFFDFSSDHSYADPLFRSDW